MDSDSHMKEISYAPNFPLLEEPCKYCNGSARDPEGATLGRRGDILAPRPHEAHPPPLTPLLKMEPATTDFTVTMAGGQNTIGGVFGKGDGRGGESGLAYSFLMAQSPTLRRPRRPVPGTFSGTHSLTRWQSRIHE
jgi:hypothetical protein